jgi:RNA-directed DNA polymerase
LSEAKPFCISKHEIWEAYRRIRSNQGSYGVDGQSIEGFERDLKNNLYKLWNRMSSGSYFPPPVRRVEIPKDDGTKRPLGIPTVSDRIAQAVVKGKLEQTVEGCFDPDSYGYRPGKSAMEAVGVARRRCWKYDWVLDIDIKGFFDNINHELLMRAVRKHTDNKWIWLYIERWLKAPVLQEDGTLLIRDKGTPQGGVISPLLANLFLHYAFDVWMRKNCPLIVFERFADDVICHCRSERQAKWLWYQLKERLAACGLELHPVKTRIIYCKDDARPGRYANESFDFLGYTFRPRKAKSRSGKCFVGFLPSASNKALKRICQRIRRMGLHRRSDKTLEELSKVLNPVIRGWINYFRHFYGSSLYRLFKHVDRVLVRWAIRKYKRLRRPKIRD